ncbi:LPXTG cell wall anchor domain-containing protein [Shimazuella sp. AN120528]|uniref:LPXTG cell wall anchor domain-containing protein n=1 Tax=Shimazuella soli TaxID=1892854 RepID=UPI001F0DA330|nr:LPXTG cell wall anchor domain-containing protein [Shimazuella soli]MCH5584722.1 LPXTG cell wall anchor domain-containing protein [Shimazuella soli]
MKRFTIPLITFLFTFFLISNAPSTIFAESNTNNNNIIQNVTDNLNSNQQVQKQDDHVKLKITDINTKKKQLTATIENATIAEGTWTYYYNGVQQASKQHNGTSLNIPLKKGYKFGDALNVKVDFSGKVDGKEMTLTDQFKIFGLKITYDNSIKGKDRFKINVTNIDKLRGDWKIKVQDEKGKVVGKYSKKDVDGFKFSHAFPDFKDGTYKVTFYFNGHMHDDEVIKFDYAKMFNVKNASTQTPGNDNNTENPKPNPGNSNTDTKPQPTKTTNDTTKAVSNGGALPKTATSYPLMIVVGATLLIIGIVMYRRNKTS